MAFLKFYENHSGSRYQIDQVWIQQLSHSRAFSRTFARCIVTKSLFLFPVFDPFFLEPCLKPKYLNEILLL